MRFIETILFAAGLVAAVTIDDYPRSGFVAGQTYTITYSPAEGGPTTFLLRQGPRGDLQTIDTLTTTATGGSFQWTPSTDLVNDDDYALQVVQGSENNYSDLFPISGGSDEAATSSAPSYSASTPASSVASSAASSAASAASSAASAASSAASVASSAISSIESSVSSVLASITSAAASASITPSAGLNSTVTSATLSKSASASSTTTKLPEVSTAAGNSLAQPMVAMLGAAAAFAYLA